MPAKKDSEAIVCDIKRKTKKKKMKMMAPYMISFQMSESTQLLLMGRRL